MERQRVRVTSSDSCSGESMSLCSSGNSSNVSKEKVTNNKFNSHNVSKELVTNNSFLVKTATNMSTCTTSPPRHHTQPPLPPGSPPGQDDTVPPESHVVKVLALVQQVFPGKDINPPPPWLKSLLPLMSEILKETSSQNLYIVTQRLMRHMRVNSAGKMSMDLVAASMLMCRSHPHLAERWHENMNDKIPKILPTPLRDMVSTGVFVPMAHLLYGEALMLGTVSHALPNGEEAAPDPYPLNTNEPPPADFVSLIRKSDVVRGLSTHACTLAYRFPILAADMHGLIRHMTILTFAYKLPAAAAIELYDAFFKEFQRQLCLTTVMPLDQFPSWLVESVFARFDTALSPP